MTKPYITIIIDDEPPAREGLLNLLGNFSETFQVVDMAQNGTEAKEKITKLKPDVIFLDIEMPGFTGFELLEQLETIPMVVFCTAYSEYALKAFDTNSVDYLVKPIQLERLQQTVNKLKLFKGDQDPQNILDAIKEIAAQKETLQMTSITVKKANKLMFVKLETISYFEAAENYVTIYTNTGDHLIEQPLSQLELKLPANFLRVHRAVIINTTFIKEVQKYFNSRFVITLSNKTKTKITTGRSYNDTIKNWMDV
ncbi:LytR/AlgR family response regulator transcription factor [Flavivirga rizhaonensis]|uniref:Response regulator n=1 Tax=Flavivirga rizhaonensis TaxID=2559571 RepID=A0A4V3P489_9FLAO|nr:response regulator [Flavivirga rizhaonensis]TGV00544.1 response regulator [Flavivirga rizhaonensis]